MSRTIILFQYIKYLTNYDRFKDFIVSKMMYFIKHLDRNGKEGLYSGSDVCDIYRYLYIIRAPNTLTYSGQHYQNFNIKLNTYSGSLYPVISPIRIKQKIICKCCGLSGHKYDS